MGNSSSIQAHNSVAPAKVEPVRLAVTADDVVAFLKANPALVTHVVSEMATTKDIQAWISGHVVEARQLDPPRGTAMAVAPTLNGQSTPRRRDSEDEDGLAPLRRGSDQRSASTGNVRKMSTSAAELRIQKTKLQESLDDEIAKRIALLEVAHDIHEELDTPRLCMKIMQSVGKLLDAERCTLFLVDKDNNELFSYVMDTRTRKNSVAPNSSTMGLAMGDEVYRIPIGAGIHGHVAQTGEIVNLTDAATDPQFSPEHDGDGIRIKTMLSMPIQHKDEGIMAVASIANKHGDKPFDSYDEGLFENFLVLCSIGLRNAKLYERTVNANKQRETLLHLAKTIFEYVEIDELVKKIMLLARGLCKAERCSVFLVDKDKEQLYSKVFDLTEEEKQKTDVPQKEIRFPLSKGIAGHVATTGVSENILEPYSDPRFNSKVDEETGFKTRNILCMPITSADHSVVGVAQLVNKIGHNGFTREDEELFTGFAVYCGIALNNAQLYDKSFKSERRLKVAMELLSYHAQAPEEDVSRLRHRVKSKLTEYGPVENFFWSSWSIADDETCAVVFGMFEELGFMDRYKIFQETLCRFVLTVRKNYRKVRYHNWQHAFGVSHQMYSIIKGSPMIADALSDVEKFAMMVACVCHDVDHRGTNNSFQQQAKSPLADVYGTSTMEKHHFAHTVTILNTDGHNIFESISNYAEILAYLEDSILATDLALYFKNRDRFKQIIASKSFDKNSADHRSLLRGILMTCCDISAITKPWEVQQDIAKIVYSEFFEQGDIERQMGRTPIPMMDRTKAEELPKMQVGFIDFICLPAFDMLAKLAAETQPLVEAVKANRERWQNMVGTEAAEQLKRELAVVPSVKVSSAVNLV